VEQNHDRDFRAVDYIGLIGKTPMELNAPEAKALWDRIRNMVVFGDYRWQPPARTNWQARERLFARSRPRQWQTMNIPKGAGKTGMWDCVGHRSEIDDGPFSFLRNHPVQGTNVECEKMAQEFANSLEWIRERLGVKSEPRIPIMGFDPGLLPGGYLSGGLPLYSAGRPPMYAHQLQVYKRLAELGKPFTVCLEDSIDMEASMKNMERFICDSLPRNPMRVVRTKPRSPINSDHHFDFDLERKFIVWDEAHIYRYNPDDLLTKLYTKEREKKYDHKAAVNRVMKHNKWHDKKGTAQRLEHIGAGYEKELKAKKNAKAAE